MLECREGNGKDNINDARGERPEPKKVHRRVNSLYQALGQQTRAKLKSESLEWATE